MLLWCVISYIYTLISIRKIKFIAYIYILFNQNLDEKLYISSKIEAVKHLHALFLVVAEQHQHPVSL